MNMNPLTTELYNKHLKQGQGTLIGNWQEEFEIRQVTGVGRYTYSGHIAKNRKELYTKTTEELSQTKIQKKQDITSERVLCQTQGIDTFTSNSTYGGALNTANKRDNIGIRQKLRENELLQELNGEQQQQENTNQGVIPNMGYKPFPEIKSLHSLVKKYVTPQLWDRLQYTRTKTTGFSLEQAIVCAVKFSNQHVGIYAGDQDCYEVFRDVFHPLILDYHNLKSNFVHTPDMDYTKIKAQIIDDSQIESTRIRVARNVDGFGLSPGITRKQRQQLEQMLVKAFSELRGDLQGKYHPLLGMNEQTRQQLVDDHFLFMNGDNNLIVAGMERDWPEGRGIFHNDNKTALVWVNEEDQLRIISMQKGGNINQVFERLVNLINAVENSINKQGGKYFQVHERYGYLTSCPSNLGTGLRASVHVHLPGWVREGVDKLKQRCNQLGVQPRGARGESGGDTGDLFDISNKYRLGYSEVQLVNMMINGVNALIQEDKELQIKHNLI